MKIENFDPIHEICSSRWIPVSAERIYTALTNSEYLAEWWGPRGFRNSFHEFEPMPGGVWRFDMHSPEGKTFENRNVFETVEPRKIVIFHHEPVHRFRLTISLNPQHQGTELTWRMAFDDTAEYEEAKGYIPECNQECFDRLEQVLARIEGPDTDERDLRLTRIINAPPREVFRAWTKPELLKQWFAPSPLTTPVAELDVRPGGSSFIVMKDEDGSEMPLRGVYLEVVENERIVATDAYTTAWEPSDKPFITMFLSFGTLDDGRTRYEARVRHWTVADRKQHEEMGFHEGWQKCTDQLARLVENS